MTRLFGIILAAIILSAAPVSAQDEGFSLGEALKKIQKKDLPRSIEARFDESELIFRYKKFSLDYSNYDADSHYVKFGVDNEIISLLGTGINWNYGVTGLVWKDSGEHYFAPVPTVGLDFYMAIMSKMKIYWQFSGMELGGKGHVHDFEAGVRYSPSKNFTLTAGYRRVGVNVRYSDNRGAFRLDGPFIGIRSDF